MYTYHNPESTAGQFNQPKPWYWWLSGSAWTALIDYTTYTGDPQYVTDIHTSLAANLGSNYDFVAPGQSGWEANDDQVYWVYAALSAMEYDFPALPCQQSANNTVGNCANSWYAISVHAFEDFVRRWQIDDTTCGGGLKWQYDPSANGWNYKNSVSNGGFFQTAARLARYSGNATYGEWAARVWDWTVEVGLIDVNYNVFDGSSDANDLNCSEINHDLWSYNVATYLHGAANMYAYTGNNSIWENIVHGLLDSANSTFFHGFANGSGVAYEQMCEPDASCNTDQASFKGSLANWMARTTVLVPSTQQQVMGLLKTSAQAAAQSCSGDGNGTCGLKWYVNGYDGNPGFGQELSALDVVQSLLIGKAPTLAKLQS